MLLVGTGKGSLFLFETRSLSLVSYNCQVLKEEIIGIYTSPNYIMLWSHKPHIRIWSLHCTHTIKDLSDMLNEKPFVLLLESQILCLSFPRDLEGEEGVVSTRDGTIWYLNLLEKSTIRL